MRYLIQHVDGDEDLVEAKSMTFDEGTLILFKDNGMKQVRAAYSPHGWLRLREAAEDEI